MKNVDLGGVDISLDLVSFEQGFDGFDFGVSLFTMNLSTGTNLNLISHEVMASVFSVNAKF